MSTQPNPAAEVFGAILRHLREQAGLTHDQVAKAVSNSPYTVVSWERGIRNPNEKTVVALEELVNGNGVLTVAASRVKSPSRFPALFDEFARYEAEAKSIRSYETMLIPGLLQVEGYARALMTANCPPLDDNEIERRVSTRLQRQTLLDRQPPPSLSFVIQESVLRQPLGGRDVLKEQLGRLNIVSQLRNVTLQVMPTDTEEHAGCDGPMVLMDTADGQSLAYVEGQGGNFWVSDPDEVGILSRRYCFLQAQAHNARETRNVIKRLTEEL